MQALYQLSYSPVLCAVRGRTRCGFANITRSARCSAKSIPGRVGRPGGGSGRGRWLRQWLSMSQAVANE
jgi:hypothetical protein